MSHSEEPSINNNVLTFLGSIGAIATFAIVVFIAYLPQQADPADQAAKETRQIKADEARAAGAAKLEGYEVVSAPDGLVRIPVEVAMDRVTKAYQASEDLFPAPKPAAPAPAAEAAPAVEDAPTSEPADVAESVESTEATVEEAISTADTSVKEGAE